MEEISEDEWNYLNGQMDEALDTAKFTTSYIDEINADLPWHFDGRKREKGCG